MRSTGAVRGQSFKRLWSCCVRASGWLGHPVDQQRLKNPIGYPMGPPVGSYKVLQPLLGGEKSRTIPVGEKGWRKSTPRYFGRCDECMRAAVAGS